MFDKEQLYEIKKMYVDDFISLEAIANKFGCARMTIRKTLTKIGVSIRKSSDIRKSPDKFDSKDVTRFWNKINKTNKHECWEWLGSKDSCGYGRFGFRYTLLSSHRVAWELTNGKIIDTLHILHRCDNPACCNPDHLFIGTHQDNMNDRDMKGRAGGGSLIGEANPRSKFTEGQIISMRNLYKSGLKQKIIAVKFHTSQPVISAIVNDKYWKHI